MERRLAEHAARPLPSGLTDPDPGASERWEAGQVWAHLAEFPGYWLDQIRKILADRAAGETGPIPFGRLKTDASRTEPIERERRTAPAELLRRVTAQIAELSSRADRAARTMPGARWACTRPWARWASQRSSSASSWATSRSTPTSSTGWSW